MIKSKFVTLVEVLDPDTGNLIDVEIRKLETGAMIGIDGSYLMDTDGDVYSPYDENETVEVEDD